MFLLQANLEDSSCPTWNYHAFTNPADFAFLRPLWRECSRHPSPVSPAGLAEGTRLEAMELARLARLVRRPSSDSVGSSDQRFPFAVSVGSCLVGLADILHLTL